MLPPINFIDALDLMHAIDADGTPIPFSIVFCTGNISGRGGMGRVIRLENVFLAKYANDIPKQFRREYTPVASLAIKDERLRNSVKRLWVGGTPTIRNFNIRLFTEFNGREVIWHTAD